MTRSRRIALVAPDNRKRHLIEWVDWNWRLLVKHDPVCTGTTGRLVDTAVRAYLPDDEASRFAVTRLKYGPLGGDQQLGAMIAEGRIDLVIFSGTRCSRSRMTSMSRRCCASPSSTTFPSPAIARRPIS